MLLELLLACVPQDSRPPTCGTLSLKMVEDQTGGELQFDRTGLSDLADAASFICVGTVDEVCTVTFAAPISTTDATGGAVTATELRFGRIRVSRVIKGDPETRFAYHEVWSIRRNDQTAAWVERPCVYFLGPGVIASSPPDVAAYASKTLSSKVVLRSVFAGQGILPVGGSGDDQWVRIHPMPEHMRHGTVHDAASLLPVIEALRDISEFAPDKITIHLRCDRLVRREGMRPGISDTFDLRVLPDGRARLATYILDEMVTHPTIDPARWAALQAALRVQVSGVDSGYNADRRFPIDRQLVVRIDGHTLAYKEVEASRQLGLDAEKQAIVERALRSWTAVMDAVPCPTCTDFTVPDKRWLDGERTR